MQSDKVRKQRIQSFKKLSLSAAMVKNTSNSTKKDESLSIWVAFLDDLAALKKASGRAIDKADLALNFYLSLVGGEHYQTNIKVMESGNTNGLSDLI